MAKPYRVLIVEDMTEMRTILSNTLRRLEVIHLTEASDAAKALAAFNAQSFDMVFLDLNLGGSSGLDVLRHFKTQSRGIFVVIVSGENTAENVTEAIKAGASGFVVKPFTLGKIQEMVRKYELSLRMR